MLGENNVFVLRGDKELQDKARREWKFILTEKDLGKASFNDIQFLLIEDDRGAEVLRVDRWTIRSSVDGKVYELGFSQARGYRACLLEKMKRDTIECSVYEEWDRRTDIEFTDSCVCYLSLDDAVKAVANYYGVSPKNVNITITSSLEMGRS